MRLNYTILFVADMKRSVAFYRDLLGISLKYETPEWTEFSTGDTTLALHIAPAADHAPVMKAGSAHAGFRVDDLDSVHGKLTGAGMPVLRSPMDLHGIRLAEYADPDGIPVSISEQRG